MFSYLRQQEEAELTQPLVIILNQDDCTLQGIKQYYVTVNSNDTKLGVLDDILSTMVITQAIVFVNSIVTAGRLQHHLETRKLPHTTAIFHGKLTGAERDTISTQFNTGAIRILISTNVLARGFHVRQINLVVNFDMPGDLESYIHRVGRSGRYGRKGLAISFVEINKDLGINEMSKVLKINETSKESQMIELTDEEFQRLC